MNIMEGSENLKKKQEAFKEGLSRSEQIRQEGIETEAIANTLDVRGLDSESVASLERAMHEFSEAYSQEIDVQAEKIEKTSEIAAEERRELSESKEQVDENASKFEQISGISDIGRGIAESGRKQAESDSSKYSSLMSEYESAMKDALDASDTIAADVKRLFK